MTDTITPEQFTEMVIKDVRKEADASVLEHLSSNYRLWLDELNVLLRDVEIQLSAQKARVSEKKGQPGFNRNSADWHSFKSEQDQWRIRTLRFKASIEARIRSVKTLRAESRLVKQA